MEQNLLRRLKERRSLFLNQETPCKLTLKRKHDHVIRIYKEGYEEQSIVVQHVTSGAVAGNLIAGGLIGWGVDAASGGQYRLMPELINIDLKPIKTVGKAGSLIDKLKELEELRKAEAITEEDYKNLKEKLLEDFKTK